eukprot:CAMPEP_0172884108 /NCGR_PEP_ID=MMETSP1075-20121228/124327_1 /TAXON_ID=2916 /ORGANISM="Ceratium fusus, Strain PA161109" /LENGTH=87 /DNA_ID=CAMNT_0013737147 /DNA_START=119 /DNA_END=379 /DNA_ORIENTATION=-
MNTVTFTKSSGNFIPACSTQARMLLKQSAAWSHPVSASLFWLWGSAPSWPEMYRVFEPAGTTTAFTYFPSGAAQHGGFNLVFPATAD